MGQRARLRHQRLAILLKQGRLSQNAWAQRLGISKSYLSQLVNGKRLYPGQELRNRLLQFLQQPFAELFEWESEEDLPESGSTPLLEWKRGRYRVRIEQLEPRDGHSGGSMIHETLQDLRLGWRTAYKNSGSSLAIILLMALGIGANTIIYSLVHASLLAPLPLPASERLLLLWESDLDSPGSRGSVSPAVYLDWKEQSKSFSKMAAYTSSRAVLTGFDEPEEIDVGLVSADFFGVLGLEPLVGTFFSERDTTPGGPRTVLISESFWRERFASDPSVVGKSLRLGGEPAQILGVVPEEANFETVFPVWQPLVFDFDIEASRGAHYLQVVARLREDTGPAEARSEMDLIAQRLAAEHAKNSGEGVFLEPLIENVIGNARLGLLVLLGTSILILVIACVNAANLILSRSAGRRREVALRRALGAPRLHLWRQFAVESLLLSLLGGALGILIAYLFLPVFVHWLPFHSPRLTAARINGNVLLVTFLVSVLSGVFFGLVPVFNSRRRDCWDELREGVGHLPETRTNRIRTTLLVAQVTLAVVLVTGAGLLVRTLVRLTSVDPGFEADHVLSLRLGLPQNRYPEERAATFFAELQEGLEQIPAVSSSGATAFLPLGGAWTFAFDIAGRPEFPVGKKPSGIFRPIAGDYFQTLGIPLLRGRFFNRNDHAQAPLVVIIDKSLADRFFPDHDPLGQELLIGYGAGEIQPREIVGVVGNVRQWGLGAGPFPGFYVPHQQVPFRAMNLVVKSQQDPMDLVPVVKSQIWDLDPELAPSQIETLEERIHGQTANSRFRTFLVGSFALLALVLAIFGVYGVIAFWVTQRIPEIGLRMALGARPEQVFTRILRKGLILTALGLLLGVGISLAGLRSISGLLFEIKATDPATYAVVSALTLMVALAACAIPAYRATRIDPARALRVE